MLNRYAVRRAVICIYREIRLNKLIYKRPRLKSHMILHPTQIARNQ
jgi:hypothetical protein